LQARTPFWFYKDIILRDFLFFRIVNVLVHKGLSCHVHDFFTMHLNSEVTIKPIWNCDQSHDPTLPNFTLFFLVTTAKKQKKQKNLIYLKEWRNIDQVQTQELNLKFEDTIRYGSAVKILCYVFHLYMYDKLIIINNYNLFKKSQDIFFIIKI